MANTYTQLYTHLVFAVKRREALISESFREETQQYITGLLQNKKHKLLAIYLMPDHAHVLIGANPALSLSETVHVLKTESTNFIKEKRFSPFQFSWQEGYGAFSHSKRELEHVIPYILNQRQHHQKQCFRDEYLTLLKHYEIAFTEKYLFDFFKEPLLETPGP